MNRKNTPSVLAILKMSDAEIQDLPDGILADMQADLNAKTKMLKHAAGVFNKELARRYEPAAEKAYKAKGQDGGKAFLTAGDLGINTERSKRVIWDQEKLVPYLSTLPPVQARKIAKFEAKISEAAYKKAPDEIRAKLDEVRAVKYGDTKFTFEQVEA